jgi:hypothetical protein
MTKWQNANKQCHEERARAKTVLNLHHLRLRINGRKSVMASLEVLQAMESVASERDRQEFALGDTLDIKTGLILAALTFLAIQSGDLIHNGLSRSGTISQTVSVAALIIGGIFVTLELWPTDYEREASPSQYRAWIDEVDKLEHSYPDSVEPTTLQRFRAARLDSALQSVATNATINKRKSKLLLSAFLCTMVAFAMNLATLATHLF